MGLVIWSDEVIELGGKKKIKNVGENGIKTKIID